MLEELRKDVLSRSRKHHEMMWKYKNDKLKQTVDKAQEEEYYKNAYPFEIRPFSE